MANNPRRGSGRSGTQNGSDLVKEQVKQQTQQVVQQTQETAGQVTDQAVQQANSILYTQKARATGTLTSLAQALRQTGDTLQEQNQAPIAGIANTAAGRIEGAAGYLDQRDVGQIINEVENFGRSNPALFLGGAVALGILVARFIKSSSPQANSGMYGRGASQCGRNTYPGSGSYRTSSAGISRYGGSISQYETAPFGTGTLDASPVTPQVDAIDEGGEFATGSARRLGKAGSDSSSDVTN